MYSVTDLRNLNNNPRINDIDLKTLVDYYEMFLESFVFEYQIEYKDQTKDIIKLRFDKENFCHLVGLESIARYSVPYTQLNNYRGMIGWNNIKTGLIDFNHLKKINRVKFKNIKAKFVYFYLLPQIVENPSMIEFDNRKVNPPTRIRSKMLFYDQKINAVIHLGIDKHDKYDYYVPRTFFIEKLNDTNGFKDIYIENQETIKLIGKVKIFKK